METRFTIKSVQAVSLALVLAVLPLESVIAHIMTDTTQFSDIKSSDARFDIVVLVGAGIIPETSQFEPEKKLSRTDLAAWGALVAKPVASSEDKPDVNALAKAALQQGLVKSLDGDATYAEINTLFFQGKYEMAQADVVPTRAEAASYIAAGLVSPAGGALLTKNGWMAGPIGQVSKVEAKTNPDGGESYWITIGGMTMPMYTHGRVGNGPSDLAKWAGRTIKRSFMRHQGDVAVWTYLEAETVEGMVEEEEPGHDHAAHSHAAGNDTADKPAETSEHAGHKH
jgi:hypothetical protein